MENGASHTTHGGRVSPPFTFDWPHPTSRVRGGSHRPLAQEKTQKSSGSVVTPQPNFNP